MRSCLRFSSLALLTVAGAFAGGVRAEIGVIPTVVEGFEEKVAASRKNDLDDNVGATLQSARVKLTLKCDPGTYQLEANASCVREAVEANDRIDEVAQVLLRSAGANKTEMKLRIYGRDGKVVQEPTAEIVDVEAAEVTTALLRKAFDPSRFSGRAIIVGAPADAELLVDGLKVESSEVTLRVGHHVLDVVHPSGATETVPFLVALDKSVSVQVPSTPVSAGNPAGAPFFASATTAGLGVAAVIGSVVMLVFSVENSDEWQRRATGRTFPRNTDDPACTDNGCVDSNGAQTGWTVGYGPLGADRQVGQGARFMMVAFSRENELRWASMREASIGLAIGGAAAIVGGGLATFALWPSDAPPE